MHKYFEIVNLLIPCPFLLKDGSRFCLQTGIPNRAPAVYKMGFPHLGLKPGAEVLFKNEPTEVLLKLIGNARRIEDLEILAKIKPKNKTLLKAAEVKRAEFL